MQGYCVKCRTKREMKNVKSVTTTNGKAATKGVCPALVSKAVIKSRLADVPAGKAFLCHDGRVMKNLEELGVALREMSEETFRYHVTADRNDFSKWVEDVIGDHELSAVLKNSSTRSQAGKLVADRR